MADAASVDLKPKRLRVEIPRGPGRLLTKRGFAVAMMQFAEGQGFKLQVDGAVGAENTSDGGALRIVSGGDTLDHPWKGKRIAGEFSVMGGWVKGNGDDIYVEAAEVTIEEGWAYLWIVFELDIEDVFVYGGTLVSATIEFFSSVPPDDNFLGNYFVPLFQFADGRVISQSATRDIYVQVCDTGLGEGAAYLNLIQS